MASVGTSSGGVSASTRLPKVARGAVVAAGIYTDFEESSCVLYKVRVEMDNYTWHVLRRYSLFEELWRKLSSMGILSNFNFPPKKWLGNFSEQVIESRKVALQDFINQVFEDQKALAESLSFFKPIRKLVEVFDLRTKFQAASTLARVTLDPLLEGDIENPPFYPPLPNEFLLSKLGMSDEHTALKKTVKTLKEKWHLEEAKAENARLDADPDLAQEVRVDLQNDVLNEIEEDILSVSRRRLQQLKPDYSQEAH